VILVDANVLIYAIDADSPHHSPARRWLEETLSGTTPVGLAWVVILAFLRITTRSGILRSPLSPEALDMSTPGFANPSSRPSVPARTTGDPASQSSGMAGNLTDARTALALSTAHDRPADNDFRDSPGDTHNPVVG
jgi:hypothetical protein